jgi:HAMP domain-containing protein
MTLRLRLRLLVSVILGALLVVTIGAALQFREIASSTDAVLAVLADEHARSTAEAVRDEATTAAVGLGILGAATLLIGAWVTRTIRVMLLDRLEAISDAVHAVRRGEAMRRVGMSDDDELGHVAAALDYVLDLRDKAESAMHGRNSELRALLVALLQNWPRPAAVTGIDGEIIVSTLSPEQEGALRSVTSQLRAAARTLLSRKFVSAAELTTDLRVDDTHAFAIKALALGEGRIVGWIAEFGPARVLVGKETE